nr:PREDICTED: LOW QUALITY PROTEIN: peroxisome proliferator-activated receptor gamma coactivator-related protein 1 [Struthio camelus australis]
MGAHSDDLQSVYLVPPAACQCLSLEEDDLNLTSLDAETILEAEEILGTMQNYLDSSVISIIEDLSLNEQNKACLDAQNELSLLTAITEILDSTDDETLSPFDTIMDAELLTSPRERENPSFQKFLSLSRPSLERESPALEQPKGLRPLSGSNVSVVGKTDTDLVWDRAAHSLEDPALPKKQVCSAPRVERKLGRHRAREQPLPQRSDGEEEEEEAALSPELDSGVEATEFCVSGARAALEEREDPCIINTGDVSLSELVKSMHPYCLPTFTVCLDPESEPVAKELLNGPVLLEIVPGEGESVEIPVVLQPLAPSFPELEPQLLGAEESAEVSILEDHKGLQEVPAQENKLEEGEEKRPLGKEPSCTTAESKLPPETAAPGPCLPESGSQGSTEALAGGKREGSEKGRGRERARKSRKKKAEEAQSEQARPGRDCVAHRLRSASSTRPLGQPPASQRRAARPSVQVSDFLAQQLERARKEGQMELRADRAPRPRGRPRSTAGASLPKKEHLESQKELEPEAASVVLAAGWDEGKNDAQPAVSQDSRNAEAVSPPPSGEQSVGMEPPQSLQAAEPGEGLPKEAKPKALSLREYRMRMLHRQPSPGSRKDSEKQVASKWPSIPEPPTELAEIPCLVSPVCPAAETVSTQKSPEKPASPVAVPCASKAPTAPAPPPAACTQPLEEPLAPASTQLTKAPPAVISSPTEVSPAAVPVAESPVLHPMEEAAGPGKGPAEKAPLETKAAAQQEPPSHKTVSQATAAPLKAGRESSLPARAPPARPWRHQPLISLVQPSDSSKDIVQAFISEIGIEATDLSSLLEQFEKSEVKKEETPVQPPEDRRPVTSSGSENQQDRKPPDSLQASELANVAGLTPPATPPHQLWKPLPAVSLLAKTKSPGSAPQEGTQKTAKLTKAKQLPQSKLRGKSPAPAPPGSTPSHVCSGDHDYCIPSTARPESSTGTQPLAESGSRWNVKHHRDITIKPISSLTKRTLDQPKPTPPAPTTAVGPSQEPLGKACLAPLDYRTSVPSKAITGCSSPPTSVLLSPAASPCRDQEMRTSSAQPSRAAAKRSLRCYRRPRDSPSPSAGSWRAGRSRASRSFSSSSDGASESSSSSSSSSSRSRSRSFSPPPKRWRRYRSRCSHSSSSRSSCGSCGRSRDRSSSSSSSSSYSSRSTSRSQSRSRSPSPRRRSNRRRRYSYDGQDHYQRQRILQKERAIEERRVVFIGKIPSRMTRSELRHRFSVFGDIEECTLHFRSEGDNYGFVTYRYAEEAFAAIESGHKLRRPDEQPFDLCFGGRRQFCRRNYADLGESQQPPSWGRHPRSLSLSCSPWLLPGYPGQVVRAAGPCPSWLSALARC